MDAATTAPMPHLSARGPLSPQFSVEVRPKPTPRYRYGEIEGSAVYLAAFGSVVADTQRVRARRMIRNPDDGVYGCQCAL